MTATVGLERLPRPIAALLDEGAANLITIANELDELVHGDASAVEAIARNEDNGDRIVHDLIGATRDSWHLGPDRAQPILLAQAVDDVVDALDTLAASWRYRPLREIVDLIPALRDTARDVARAVATINHPADLEARLARCREREQEVRRVSRAARTWLLVEQTDPQLAIRGHGLLGHADTALRACTRLSARLHSHALA